MKLQKLKKKRIMLSQKPSRLRRTSSLRNLVRETRLSVDALIRPIFVTHHNKRLEIASMPGQFYFPLDEIEKTIEETMKLGIKGIILFGIAKIKDDMATETINENGIIQQTVRKIRLSFPELIIITDACFCQYTTHGHCGILDNNGSIDRKSSLKQLQGQTISHVDAGADFVAPSCMIDGMVKHIRDALDENGYEDRGILSYAIKYASAFYGPFRYAFNSSPKQGDRKSYQMDPGNIREALKEAQIDEDEGADIIMVKPALPYMDVIKEVKNQVSCPVAAYQVSGEYAMIKAAAQNNWMDENESMMESLLGIKRSGADIIITYFADTAARIINSKS
jgi:porphobilinogen synthase